MYLFAYGTLAPGRAPAEIAWAVDQLRPVSKGFVHGRLYDLGEYPGAILDASAQQKIHGTVYRLPQHCDLLPALDQYEEFDPIAPEQSLFLRVLANVELFSGQSLPCWIYVYNRHQESARIVAGSL